MGEELSEEELEYYESQQALQAGAPPPPSKDSIFKFFRDLLRIEDSSKVGNLTQEELGRPDIPVRGYQSIALDLEKGWGWDKVGEFMMLKGEQTLATSLSRKGFLPSLFVTQIKKEQKVKPTEQKKGLFGFGKKEESEET